jgi:hypothetical protein
MRYEMIERHERARDELGRVKLRSLTAFMLSLLILQAVAFTIGFGSTGWIFIVLVSQ